MATCVPLAITIALSLAAPPVTAPTVTAPPPPPEPPTPLGSPWITPPDELGPRDVPAPGPTPSPPLPAERFRVTGPPYEVSLGAGWEATQGVVVPRQAGARVAISPPDVTVWAPPPQWAPPPPAVDRYEGSQEWRTIHLGLAIGVVGILTAVGLGLTLSQDPDAPTDGLLPPSTQYDAFFPR